VRGEGEEKEACVRGGGEEEEKNGKKTRGISVREG
jgi:hypothetical protein